MKSAFSIFMRYAVFSDVHSNLEAFRKVLDSFEKSRVDKYAFIGDIVGYGADPAACIALLKGLGALSVAGNHDWAVTDFLTTDYFNEAARQAVVWTQEKISASDKAFISGFRLVENEGAFCLVHGTLDHPEDFDYMTDRLKAMKTFYALQKQVCFVAHSHQPGIFVEDPEGVSYRRPPDKLFLEKGRRYIVNDGSVGQPRDGDPRACCCIYDDEDNTLEFKRVEYDVKTAAEKILKSGLPRSLAQRLKHGH